MPEFNKLYLLDTDVLGNIQDRPDSANIYAGIVEGIKAGKVKTVRQVLDELKRFEKAAAALVPYKDQFQVETGMQYCEQVAQAIEYITNTVGDLFQQVGGKNPDPADPWLIGVAKVHGFVLVTDERRNSPKKIPGVCKLDGIKCQCISGPHFLYETGIVTEIKPEYIGREFYASGA